jgi:hypothetical protein
VWQATAAAFSLVISSKLQNSFPFNSLFFWQTPYVTIRLHEWNHMMEKDSRNVYEDRSE